MARRIAGTALIVCALPAVLTACIGTSEVVAPADPQDGPEATCLFAGTGATIAVEDKRANFDCGSLGEDLAVVLVGDVVAGEAGWAIDRAVVEQGDAGYQPTDVATVPVNGIGLSDGSVCRFAGTGATITVEGQRAAFTCGVTPDGAELVLVGDIVVGDSGWTILKATVSRSESGEIAAVASETAVIESLAVPAAPAAPAEQ